MISIDFKLAFNIGRDIFFLIDGLEESCHGGAGKAKEQYALLGVYKLADDARSLQYGDGGLARTRLAFDEDMPLGC